MAYSSNIKSLYGDIKPFYEVFLSIALFLSSFSIPLIFFIFTFNLNLPENVIYFSLLIIAVIAALRDKTKSKIIKQAIDFLGRTIMIFGSSFVLLLFFNAYFKISILLYDFYLKFWETWTFLMNQFVLSLTFSIAFIFFYLFFTAWLGKFITDKTKKTELGFLSFLILFVIIPFFFHLFNKGDSLTSGIWIISEKSAWIFGFSLIFLHLSYLLKEFRQVFKRNRLDNHIYKEEI